MSIKIKFHGSNDERLEFNCTTVSQYEDKSTSKLGLCWLRITTLNASSFKIKARSIRQRVAEPGAYGFRFVIEPAFLGLQVPFLVREIEVLGVRLSEYTEPSSRMTIKVDTGELQKSIREITSNVMTLALDRTEAALARIQSLEKEFAEERRRVAVMEQSIGVAFDKLREIDERLKGLEKTVFVHTSDPAAVDFLLGDRDPWVVMAKNAIRQLGEINIAEAEHRVLSGLARDAKIIVDYERNGQPLSPAAQRINEHNTRFHERPWADALAQERQK